MSFTGIASGILSALNGFQNNQSSTNQARNEFQQLGQDLQSGNLTQAQQDFATLTQNLTSVSPSSNAAGGTNNASPLAQAFNHLGQDLQSGNLQGAQQDFATVQQDLQQVAAQVGGHHHGHHHHAESSQQSSSTQQNNPVTVAFGQLAQSLQGGNLQGAQQAFATLLNDLQQIGGFTTSGSGSTSAAPAPGSLNVTA